MSDRDLEAHGHALRAGGGQDSNPNFRPPTLVQLIRGTKLEQYYGQHKNSEVKSEKNGGYRVYLLLKDGHSVEGVIKDGVLTQFRDNSNP